MFNFQMPFIQVLKLGLRMAPKGKTKIRPGVGGGFKTASRYSKYASSDSDLEIEQVFSFAPNAVPQDYSLKVQLATRGLLATDHVILNHGQVTWTTPELAPPLLTTTPHQGKDASALDRFKVHHYPTRRVFSGSGLELVTRQATIRYLDHYRSQKVFAESILPKP
ncbi:uncharacterized protein TNCV_1899021 [Trichonephila clavipes]|nr:uncharacterized protein TNCV_1899021 [Trichonephila clavipes]